MPDFSTMIRDLGWGPTIAGAAIIALIVYSIFKGGKGGGGSNGGSSSSGGSAPTPPAQQCMGLFTFRKKADDNKTIRWLNEVDQAYNKAFQTRNAAGLEKYLTRPCLATVMENVRLGQQVYAGLDRYRHVAWTNDGKTPDTSSWIKDVTYDDVKMSHGVVVPVGDAYHERWKLVIDTNQNRISEIRRIG